MEWLVLQLWSRIPFFGWTVTKNQTSPLHCRSQGSRPKPTIFPYTLAHKAAVGSGKSAKRSVLLIEILLNFLRWSLGTISIVVDFKAAFALPQLAWTCMIPNASKAPYIPPNQLQWMTDSCKTWIVSNISQPFTLSFYIHCLPWLCHHQPTASRSFPLTLLDTSAQCKYPGKRAKQIYHWSSESHQRILLNSAIPSSRLHESSWKDERTNQWYDEQSCKVWWQHTDGPNQQV